MEILITGIILGGIYTLMAMGLNLQYGVSHIMNLASGEILVAGSFLGFWFWTSQQISPFFAVIISFPLAFVINWFIYRYLMIPLVKRSKNRGQLETNSILATFGLSFLMIGLMLIFFGGEYFSYSYLNIPIQILGDPYGLNRAIALVVSIVICAFLYLWLYHSRIGMAIRAIAINPNSARLVSINVLKMSAIAFALGGGITASAGVLLGVFLPMDASIGIIFTMKALIIIIMGGVGDIRGVIVASLLLAITETAVATIIDPGLTLAAAYLLFVIILLFRPQGIFGKRLV